LVFCVMMENDNPVWATKKSKELIHRTVKNLT
jgi:hypothetical protein